MKCRVPAIAASALAAAMTLAFSPGANAAVKARILTYTEQSTTNWTGLGVDAGNYSRSWENQRVELRPHLAFTYNWHLRTAVTGARSSSGQTVVVGGRRYVRTGNGRWTSSTLTPKQIRTYEYGMDPNVTLAKIDALPGIRRVAARHYRVTGTYARVGSFLAFYNMSASYFEGSDIKTFRIDLWVDSHGRPVKDAVAGRSAIWAFSLVETFANYNKPVVIRVP
jgi:hypothetical protein